MKRILGSSPRSRGTYCRMPESVQFHAVHPRARGEHDFFGRPDLVSMPRGSSPRSRGTSSERWRRVRRFPTVHPRARGEHKFGFQFDRLALQRRFIPALAGNIPIDRYSAGRLETTVHPRARGEHECKGWGSRLPLPRFIPALAGNMREMIGCQAISVTVGSSPRSRGTSVLR